jgi:hypothetical protein
MSRSVPPNVSDVLANHKTMAAAYMEKTFHDNTHCKPRAPLHNRCCRIVEVLREWCTTPRGTE